MAETQDNCTQKLVSITVIMTALIFAMAIAAKLAVYVVVLPYFWKIIGFDMNVALKMADTVSTSVAIAMSLFLVVIISGMYLVKKLR